MRSFIMVSLSVSFRGLRNVAEVLPGVSTYCWILPVLHSAGTSVEYISAPRRLVVLLNTDYTSFGMSMESM
jgi:hypothetical protein